MLHQVDFLAGNLMGQQAIDTAPTHIEPTLYRNIQIQSLYAPVGQ